MPHTFVKTQPLNTPRSFAQDQGIPSPIEEPSRQQEFGVPLFDGYHDVTPGPDDDRGERLLDGHHATPGPDDDRGNRFFDGQHHATPGLDDIRGDRLFDGQHDSTPGPDDDRGDPLGTIATNASMHAAPQMDESAVEPAHEAAAKPTNDQGGVTFDAQAVDRYSDEGGSPAPKDTASKSHDAQTGGGAQKARATRGLVATAEAAYQSLRRRAKQAWNGLTGS